MSAQRKAATKPKPAGGAAVAAQPRTAPKAKTAPRSGSAARGAPQQRESRLRKRFESLKTLAQNTLAEIRKVTWPDAQTTRNLTILVIVMSIVLGLMLGGIDFLLLKLFEII